MLGIRQYAQRFISNKIFNTNNSNCLPSIQQRSFNWFKEPDEDDDKGFLKYNKVIFPPQKPDEPKRPGYVCHVKKNIKYSPLKMWYVACFVRGMSVDEAIKQLSFLKKKGAAIAKDAILEAQRMAVEEHNIEFKSNLWVAESLATKAFVYKGLRRHARGRFGIVHYRYCHYFVRLEEGKPPKHYYQPAPKTGEEWLQEWIEEMRNRKIYNSL